MNSPDIPDQGTNSFKKTVFATLTIIFGAGAALIGMLGIIGMIFGIPLFTSLFPGYKTIAFSVSVIWIIFGSVLACHAATPLRGSVRTCTAAVVALIAILAAVEFPLNILGKHFIVEIWAIQIADAISAQPTTPTSPVAVVLVVSAAIALFFMLYAYGPSKEEEQARDVVGILGLAISLVSFTFVLSYFYGTPFLYGTPLIPIAFTSAIAALCIGAGLVTSAGPAAIPLKYITGPSTRARLLRFFLPLSLVIIFVENFLVVTVTSYYKVHNALLLSLSIVLFSIITTFVVGKVSGTVSHAIDRAEQERKEAEDALRESDEKYRLVAEHMTDTVWLMDMDIKTTYQSPSSEKLRGYTSQEIKDLPLEKNLTPESLKLALEVFFKEIPKIEADPGYNPVKILELEYYRKDGTTFWSENKFSIIRDGSGKPVSILGEGRDVTERKRIEDTLRESELRFRSLVEHALEGILILDLQGTILFANNAAARTIEADDCAGLIGRNVMEFIAPESQEDVVRDFIQVSQGHDAYLAQYNAISAKGNKFCVESIGKVISYEGKPADLISIQDITERKQAEDALRESENRYRAVVEDQTEFICRFTPEGTLTFVNDAYCRYFGLKREECIGKRHTVVLPPDDLSLMKKHIRSLTLENPVGFIEHRIIMLSGEVRWQRWSDRAIFDKDGHVVEYQSVGRDIIERKETG